MALRAGPCRRAPLLATALALLAPAPAPAQVAGRLGTDRLAHVGFSAAVAAGGYGVGAALFDRVPLRLVVGLGAGLAAGFAKELADAAGLGEPELGDLVADLVGIAAGLVLAWAVGRAVARARAGPHARGRSPALAAGHGAGAEAVTIGAW